MTFRSIFFQDKDFDCAGRTARITENGVERLSKQFQRIVEL